MSTIRETAIAVGSYADQKIRVLQRAYLKSGGQATSARAHLARLRRMDSDAPGSWIQVGEDIFDGFSNLDLRGTQERRAIRTVTATLQLYAIHQQSKDRGMAYFGDGDAAAKRSMTFGESCRMLATALGEQGRPGVLRRLTALEGVSDDFEGAVHYLRSLITLMKTQDIPVDYRQLGRDLFLMQHPSTCDDVFMRWSRDFYSQPSKSEATEEKDGSALTDAQ